MCRDPVYPKEVADSAKWGFASRRLRINGRH